MPIFKKIINNICVKFFILATHMVSNPQIVLYSMILEVIISNDLQWQYKKTNKKDKFFIFTFK